MTIAIGINLGFYAILAADTRTTYHLVNMPFYDDNSSKVQKTTMGLITGAGFCPLLDGVKNRLANEQIISTDSVLAIIKEERENTLQTCQTYSQIESWIEQTGWIFSYMTLQNDQLILRVSIFHPSISKEMYATYEVGQPAIIFPLELDREKVDAIYNPVIQEIEVPDNTSELQSSIAQNSRIIAALINVLQPLCPSISNRFQIGIHMGGQTGVSDLIDIQDNETFSLNIKLENP